MYARELKARVKPSTLAPPAQEGIHFGSGFQVPHRFRDRSSHDLYLREIAGPISVLGAVNQIPDVLGSEPQHFGNSDTALKAPG